MFHAFHVSLMHAYIWLHHTLHDLIILVKLVEVYSSQSSIYNFLHFSNNFLSFFLKSRIQVLRLVQRVVTIKVYKV
jgi:hypothetical protein